MQMFNVHTQELIQQAPHISYLSTFMWQAIGTTTCSLFCKKTFQSSFLKSGIYKEEHYIAKKGATYKSGYRTIGQNKGRDRSKRRKQPELIMKYMIGFCLIVNVQAVCRQRIYWFYSVSFHSLLLWDWVILYHLWHFGTHRFMKR